MVDANLPYGNGKRIQLKLIHLRLDRTDNRSRTAHDREIPPFEYPVDTQMRRETFVELLSL